MNWLKLVIVLELSCVHVYQIEGYLRAALVLRRVLCTILGLLNGSSWHTVNLVAMSITGPFVFFFNSDKVALYISCFSLPFFFLVTVKFFSSS